MQSFDPVAFIRANLPVADVPFVPELRMHRASSASGVSRLEDREGLSGAPYWAFYWAGGLALARHILDRRDVVAGRRVLDLGAGSGLVAISAAKAGALLVFANDIDPYAIAATTLNASLNGVEIELQGADITAAAPPDVDLILVGDLLYEPALADRVIAFLRRCAAMGIKALIGDPGRASFPSGQLTRIAEYDVAETNCAATRRTGIFELTRS